MLEVLQYATSSLWVFLGCMIFTCGVIMSLGWSLNAMFIGIKGEKCNDVNILS